MRILRGIGLSGCGERMSQCMGLLLACRLMLAAAVIIAGRSFFRHGSASLSLLYVAAGVLVLTMLYMYMVRRSYPTLPLLDLQIGADLLGGCLPEPVDNLHDLAFPTAEPCLWISCHLRFS